MITLYIYKAPGDRGVTMYTRSGRLVLVLLLLFVKLSTITSTSTYFNQCTYLVLILVHIIHTKLQGRGVLR